jgi:hypothetical protein
MLVITALACSMTGCLPPPPADEKAPSQIPKDESTLPETPSHTLTATRRPSSTPTPECIIRADSKNKSEIQKEVDSLIPGADVLLFDDFQCDRLDDEWGMGGMNPKQQIVVSNGIVSIHAEKYNDLWVAIARTHSSLHDDMGILALFRFKEKTIGNPALVNVAGQISSIRSWMLELRFENTQTAGWVSWEGTDWAGGFLPPGTLRPGTWYYLLLRMGPSGKYTGKVWEKDFPEKSADFYRFVNSGWAGLHLNAALQVYEGTIDLDRYFELSFAGNE